MYGWRSSGVEVRDYLLAHASLAPKMGLSSTTLHRLVDRIDTTRNARPPRDITDNYKTNSFVLSGITRSDHSLTFGSVNEV